MEIKIGSRASKLAMIQTAMIAKKIDEFFGYSCCSIIPVKTSGDTILDKNLYDIGGKALFLKEIENLLLSREIDLAVHSLKDVPAILPEGLVIAAVLERENPSEMLVSKIAGNIAELPIGAKIGTSSVRRKIQLLKMRADLNIVMLRGNVDTRVEKILRGDVDATILAYAGLKRLHLHKSNICNIIPSTVMLPAVGQGVIAVEAREDNNQILDLCKKINHSQTWQITQIERGFLEGLNADCYTPVAALANIENDGNDFSSTFFLGSEDMDYSFFKEVKGKMLEGRKIGIQVAKEFLEKKARK